MGGRLSPMGLQSGIDDGGRHWDALAHAAEWLRSRPCHMLAEQRLVVDVGAGSSSRPPLALFRAPPRRDKLRASRPSISLFPPRRLCPTSGSASRTTPSCSARSELRARLPMPGDWDQVPLTPPVSGSRPTSRCGAPWSHITVFGGPSSPCLAWPFRALGPTPGSSTPSSSPGDRASDVDLVSSGESVAFVVRGHELVASRVSS